MPDGKHFSSRHNARLLDLRDPHAMAAEMELAGADPGGIRLMLPKALFRAVRLDGITLAAANVLKQEILSRGGEAVVSRGVADLSVSSSDAVILGTEGQLRSLARKLKGQPFGLTALAQELEQVLDTAASDLLPPLRLGSRDFAFGSRTYLMGVLNVTPDSFSDGGLFFDPGEAVDQALRMIAEGADIIDVGGESARPGSVEIGEEEELRRIRPVLERLLRECGAPVSVDTYKASVARAALEMGAHMINDIGGLRADPAMPGVLASYGAPAVIMHNKREAIYRDVMGEVISFLRKGIDLAVEAGLPRERIVVDPGFGFGKTPAHNLTVLRRLREIRSLGVPVMIGTSRKSTIGKVLGLPVEERLEGTAATVALAVAAGADFIRVHDVREMARVARMADAVVRDADRAAGPGGITGRAPGALGHPEPGAEPGVEPGADGGRRLDGNRLDGGWVEDRVNGRLDGREGGS